MPESRRERRSFDWQAAYARLDRAAQALATGEEPSPEQKQRILAERARDLARPAEAEAPGELLELLVFPVAQERYAVDVTSVEEVSPLRGLTRLPGAPAPFVGIVPHRGRVVPILDLRRIAGAATAIDDGSQGVVVGVGDAVFGLLSHGPGEVVRLPAQALAPPIQGKAESFVRGLTRDAVAVLDLQALLADERIAMRGPGAMQPKTGEGS